MSSSSLDSNDKSGVPGDNRPGGISNMQKSTAGKVSQAAAHADSEEFACPKCGAARVAKSRAVGYDHLLMRFIPWRPCRCLRCYHRFWRREGFFADKRRLSSWVYVLVGLTFMLLVKTQLQTPPPSQPALQEPRSGQVGDPPGITSRISPVEIQEPENTQQVTTTELVIQQNDKLSTGAKRDIIENLAFSKPQSIDQRLPTISSDELKSRLAAAKIKAEAAELANQQNQSYLNNEVSAEPAEAQSLLKIDINYRIEQWRNAWEAGDAVRYLEFYAEDFAPATSTTRQQWRSQRISRVAPEKNIKLQLSAFSIKFADSNTRATVRFDQRYRSNTFAADSRKELVLSKSGEQWYIVSERELDK